MNELYTTQSIYEERVEVPMAIYNPITGESTGIRPSKRKIQESIIRTIFISFSSERSGAEVAIHELYRHLRYHDYNYSMQRRNEPPWDTEYEKYYQKYYGDSFASPHPPLPEKTMHFDIREGGIPVGFLYKYQDAIKNLTIETRAIDDSNRLILGMSYKQKINLLPYSDGRYSIDKECKQDIYYYLFSLKTNKLLKNSANLNKLED